MRPIRFAAAAAVLFALPAMAQFQTTNLGTESASQLIQTLTGPGITITNVVVTGSPLAIGSFSGGKSVGLPVDSGVILSSGNIAGAAGPNTVSNFSTTLGTPGDTALNDLVAPYQTHDATVIEFDAVTTSDAFSIQYSFASEEYREYVGSPYNDVFAFFVDGQNIALVPGSKSKVSINSINHIANAGFYQDNPVGSTNTSQFDGYTTLLTAIATVTPAQTHHIKIAIADTSDSILDSAVFLERGGIRGGAVGVGLTVDPYETTLEQLQNGSYDVRVYGIPEKQNVTLSGNGISDGTSVSFSPSVITEGAESNLSTMTLTIGPDAETGPHFYTVTGTLPDNGGSFSTQILVNVDCRPPFILDQSSYQPMSASVAAGSRATLRVAPSGTGPFTYQWYRGAAGIRSFAMRGSTGAEMTTPPINSPQDFHVRVTNPCGAVDSWTATVSPTGASGGVVKPGPVRTPIGPRH